MKRITEAQERFWFERYEAGDPAAREQIVLAYARLAKRQVADLLDRYRYFDFLRADLEQEALIALIKAVERYDRSRKCRFSTFAYRCIHSRLIDKLRQEKNYHKYHKPLDRLATDQNNQEPYRESEPEHKILSALWKEGSLTVLLEKTLLTHREAQMCSLLMDNPAASNAEIGRKLGISRERARQIRHQLRTKVGLESTLKELVA